MIFRQVKIRPNDIHLQRILCSPSSEVPVQHYVLLTVTYGTMCAPYLASRTLKQFCADECSRFPEAVEIMQQDLYMDDFLSGSHDLESTKRLRDQLIRLLTAGGFNLKKWVANDAELLAEIPPDDRLRSSWVKFSTEGPVSELGMGWDPVTDQFKFRPPPAITDPILTIDRWLKFREGRSEVAGLSIPRWFKHAPNRKVQLHAFSDASRRAMAGVLYSRTTGDDGETYTVLIEAKSKLASIKSLMSVSKPSHRMTIPRLELRAALIAARLLNLAASVLGIPMTSCLLWSDSQIVLHWLRSDGPIENDLVDNYVAHIQELTAGATWHHVPTDCNPADVASRGSEALTLIHQPLWWNGPDWLAKSESEWAPVSVASENSNETPEIREQRLV